MSTTNPAASANNSILTLFAPILGEETVKNGQIQAALKHVAQALEISEDTEQSFSKRVEKALSKDDMNMNKNNTIASSYQDNSEELTTELEELEKSLINLCSVYADTNAIKKTQDFNADDFKQQVTDGIKNIIKIAQERYTQENSETNEKWQEAIHKMDIRKSSLPKEITNITLIKTFITFTCIALIGTLLGVTIGPLFGATSCAAIAAKSLAVAGITIKAPALLAIGAGIASLAKTWLQNKQDSLNTELINLGISLPAEIKKYNIRQDQFVALQICQEVFGMNLTNAKAALNKISNPEIQLQ